MVDDSTQCSYGYLRRKFREIKRKGFTGLCLFCKTPKPKEMSREELKDHARKAIDAGELMIATLHGELQEAQAEIERLRGELAAAKADSERLDWLEATNNIAEIVRAGNPREPLKTVHVDLDINGEPHLISGETWRAAIDAARKGGEAVKTYRLWALADERGRLWTLLDGTPKIGARKPEGIQTHCPPPFRKELKTPRTYRPVRVRVTVEAI
jgi:hypothetical protein